MTYSINGAMKKIPQWRKFVPTRGEAESGILLIKDTRKEYLNFYREKMKNMKNMGINK